MAAVEKREFTFAQGSNITIGIVNNADGTQTVTISASASGITASQNPNPGVNSTGPGDALPSNTPATWFELSSAPGFWIPAWQVNS